MSFTRFNTWCLSLVLILVALTTCLNYWVDPFDVYHIEANERAANKPFRFKKPYLQKASTVFAKKPDTLVIGNSRSEYAYNPKHPAFHGSVTYNASLSGGSMAEAEAMINHAVAAGGLKRIIFAIDYGMFWREAKPWKNRLYLPYHNNKTYASFSLPHHELLLSFKTIKYSLLELFSNERDEKIHVTGVRNHAYYVEKNKSKSRWKAFKKYLERFNSELIEVASSQTLPIHAHHSLVRSAQEASFLRILATLKKHNIQTTMIVSPVHAYYFALLEKHGYWDDYLYWLGQITQYVFDSGAPVTVWDASGFHAVSTELVPEFGSQIPMRGYWEASHFRQEIGDAILDRVLLQKDNSMPLKAIKHFHEIAPHIQAHQVQKKKYFLTKHKTQLEELLH